jgi:titin
LVNGTTYVFRVAALNTAGQGQFSDATVPVSPRSLPSAPSNVKALASDGAAQLTWSKPASEGSAPVTDYIIQSSLNNGVTWTILNDAVSPATAATVTGLSNGSSYRFRVATVTTAGQGDWSSPTTSISPVGVASAPTSVTAVVGEGQAVLSWSTPASAGGSTIVGYTVQWSSNGGTSWNTRTGVPATNTFTVSNLTNGVTYVFRVAAVNLVGTGAFSAATAPQTPLGLPQQVTKLEAVALSGGVRLTWMPPASTGGRPVSNYLIDYRTVDSADWIRFNGSPSTATTATVTGLMLGRGYVFRVTAVTSFGESGATETTNAVVPMNAPSRVSGRVINRAVVLGWTAPRPPARTRIVNYVIQYSSDAGANWITVNRAASAAPRAAVSGLVNGSSYVFRVAAVTPAGIGAFSASSALIRLNRR